MDTHTHTTTLQLPADLVQPILEQLTKKADLCRCALVNRVFYAAAVPVLYRDIEVKHATIVVCSIVDRDGCAFELTNDFEFV